MLNERYLDSNQLRTLIFNTITQKSLESQLKSPTVAKITTKRNNTFYRSAKTTLSDNQTTLSENQRLL